MTAAPPDPNLLADYVRTGSKAAFEQIVTQYIHLVHAAAVRQVHDTHLAEDITQAVFLLLWQRAASLQPNGSLAGWLLVATHHISANAIKKEWRLKKREQKVAQMKPEQDPSFAPVDSILPQLDFAIAQLKTVDRDAIVERFFNSCSLEEVGATLGVSQQAAAKRISRAMEKLRDILAKRGITTSEAMLSSLLPSIAHHPGASASLLSTVLTGHAAAGPTALAYAARPTTALLKPLAAALALLGLCGIVYLAVVLQRAPAVQSPLAAAPQPQAPAAPAPPPRPANDRTISLFLVDSKTGAALPNGRVELDINSNSGPSKPVGPDGKYELHLPAQYQSVRAVCRVPGRVAMAIEFQNYTFKGDLAGNFIIPMEVGTTVGGIVLNDIGDPVAGAKVHIGSFLNGNADAPRIWLYDDVITDPQGKWHFDNFPAKYSQFFIEVSHLDYPTPQETANPPIDPLLRGAFETVMTQTGEGNHLPGVVLDPDGKPVAGAQVVAAVDRYESNKPTTTTDAQGKFSLNVRQQEWDQIVTVVAKGFAPQQAKIPTADKNAKPDNKPLKIQLSPSVKLEGIVVDGNGKPVSGATVEVERWRNNRALKWSTKTDRNGKFVWNDAPADELQLNVSRRNMASVMGAKVTAGGAPIHLTIYPPLKITGNVIDADTKQPITAFRIVYGFVWTVGQPVVWQPQDSRQLGGGKYQATIDDFSNGGQLRIEADGYLAAESRLIMGNEGNVQINFELKKGKGPAGVVLDPGGKPLFNVRVICVPEDQTIYIDADRDNSADRTGIDLAQTDKDGHFSFPPEEKKFALIVSVDEGFAFVKGAQLPKDGQIHLQKWGKIEGDYRLDASPASLVKIVTQAKLPIGPYNDSEFAPHTVTTDLNGHFVIDRIPPMEDVSLSQSISVGSGFQQYLRLGDYKITSGQNLTVQLGGKGRPVIGKVSLPAISTDQADYSRQLSINMQTTGDTDDNFLVHLPYPENFPDMSEDQQGEWYKPQIKAHYDALQQAKITSQTQDVPVTFAFNSDGTFRADNVSPGTYTGQASFNSLTSFSQQSATVGNQQNLPVTGRVSFTVPTTPACPTNVPLDIGTIQLTPSRTPEIGKPMPLIQLITLDGQPVDQSAWARKIILLHVWDMHDRKFFPALRELAGKYKDNPRVQIVNAGMQMLPAWAKHIDAQEHLPGFLTLDKDSSELNMRAAYEDHAWMVSSSPTVLVIDAHSNLAAKVTDPNQLSSAVEQAIGK